MEQLSRFDSKGPQYQLGTFEYLNDTSSNLTCGALDALPLLLPHATPSISLLAALKRPFDTEVLLRTPSSSRKALCIIQDYLVVGASTVNADVNSPLLISNTILSTNRAPKLI